MVPSGAEPVALRTRRLFLHPLFFGKIAKIADSLCTLPCACALDRRPLVQPNPDKTVLNQLQQRLGLEQARVRVSARHSAENS